jgi:hypothetical protein
LSSLLGLPSFGSVWCSCPSLSSWCCWVLWWVDK